MREGGHFIFSRNKEKLNQSLYRNLIVLFDRTLSNKTANKNEMG